VKWEANKCVYSHTPDRVDLGLSQTLSDLRLDYLDLYLMHWPVGQGPSEKKYSYDYLETWHAMQVLLASGRVRHIGISNFSPAQRFAQEQRCQTQGASDGVASLPEPEELGKGA
jgi:diketogulonate reductase-like aldo/keto reductase